MKVFCIDCKHLKISFSPPIDANEYNCKHPDNTVPSKEPNTWLEPGLDRIQYYMLPKYINVLNLCPWFEKIYISKED